MSVYLSRLATRGLPLVESAYTGRHHATYTAQALPALFAGEEKKSKGAAREQNPRMPAPHLSRLATKTLKPANDHLIATQLETQRLAKIARTRTPDTMIVSGASGQIGSRIVLQGLEQGRPMVLITRNRAQLAAFSRHPLVTLLEAGREQQVDPEFMGRRLEQLCAGQRVTYVNGLGVASVPSGSRLSLVDINVHPFTTILDHLESGENRLYQRCRVIDLNSLGVSIVEAHGEEEGINDEYLLSRQMTAQRLHESPLDHLCLRVSYVYFGPENGHLNMKHGWGPDQMANFLVQVMIGSGKQTIQPVHIRDIVDGVFGFNGGRLHINGVGPDRMTMNQFFKRFCDMIGTQFRPVHMSHEMAENVTAIFPNGHAAPYSVVCSRILEKLDRAFDHQPMEALLGRNLTTFEDTFKEFQTGSFTLPSAPIYEQIKGMLINASTDPVKFKRLITLLFTQFPAFTMQAASAILKG